MHTHGWAPKYMEKEGGSKFQPKYISILASTPIVYHKETASIGEPFLNERKKATPRESSLSPNDLLPVIPLGYRFPCMGVGITRFICYWLYFGTTWLSAHMPIPKTHLEIQKKLQTWSKFFFPLSSTCLFCLPLTGFLKRNHHLLVSRLTFQRETAEAETN